MISHRNSILSNSIKDPKNALNKSVFSIAKNKLRPLKLLSTFAITLSVLSACTLTAPLTQVTPQGTTAATITQAFVAPLPVVNPAQEAVFKDWWAQFNDAVLSQLVTQAVANNPSIAQARASIVAARSVVAQSQAGLFPSVSANASANASGQRQAGVNTTSRTLKTGLDALWELDLFGYNQSLSDAARARATQATAQFGDTSVSISAEVANIYVGLRTSQMLEAVYAQDKTATAQTATLTTLKIKAGFEAQANAGLAEGDAAEAANRLIAQREQTALYVKALVALTNQNEATLRSALRLENTPVALPAPKLFSVTTLPAQLLAQRADVAAAAANVIAASADWRAAQADQYPRISLLGTLGLSRISSDGTGSSTRNWSIGPSISLPLLDAGKRQAATDGAKARADIAQASFEQIALRAVQEAEEGLVRLDSATARSKTAEDAVRGYVNYLEGAQLRHKNGLASLLELAQAQRTTVAANAALLQVQRERVQAWIALYKALGGGWQMTERN
jgi:outer membrane protein, multidrug efflux system